MASSMEAFLCEAHGVYIADCGPCMERVNAEVEAERRAFLEAGSAALWVDLGAVEEDHVRPTYRPFTGAQVAGAAAFVLLVVLLMVLMAGCAVTPMTRTAGTAGPTTTKDWTPDPAWTTPPQSNPALAGATANPLALVAVSDTPSPGEPYRRDLWPHWKDPDGNGCDAREDALVKASNPPAQVGSGCKVGPGAWRSDYDGLTFTEPGKLDVDHVVPLAEAHRSGGSTWSTDRRAAYANDQAGLWPVSAASNRSKSDQDPATWRPPERGVWCTYAHRWLQVKTTYTLTMDTPERDALGEMLSTC